VLIVVSVLVPALDAYGLSPLWFFGFGELLLLQISLLLHGLIGKVMLFNAL